MIKFQVGQNDHKGMYIVPIAKIVSGDDTSRYCICESCDSGPPVTQQALTEVQIVLKANKTQIKTEDTPTLAKIMKKTSIYHEWQTAEQTVGHPNLQYCYDHNGKLIKKDP